MCLLALLLFGATAYRCLNAPLRFDEVDFAAQAQGILRHGVPKLTLSEDKIFHLHPYLGYNAHYGMWHPPLYLYSLASSLVLFGNQNWAYRLPSLLWFLLSLGLGYCILDRLSGQTASLQQKLLSGMLILMSPLLAEGSLYVDIDNSSLTCSLLLFTLFLLKTPDRFSWRWTAGLILLFTFCLWSKLTTPFILLASFILYEALRGKIKPGLGRGLIIGVFATLFFLLTYGLYCAALDYPFDFMFKFTYGPKGHSFLTPTSPKMILHALRWSWIWISPPVALIFLTALFSRARHWIRSRKPEGIDLLLLFFTVGFLSYVGWMGLWGKYTFPLVFFGALGSGYWMPGLLPSVQIQHRRRLMLLWAGLVLFHVFFIPPLQVRSPGFNLQTATLWQCLLETRNLPPLLSTGAFALFFLTVRGWGLVEKKSAWHASLLLYLLAANPISVIKSAMTPDDWSPYHPLRERGFTDTAQFLNQSLSGRDILLCPKDLGFYFKGRHIPTDHFWVANIPLELGRLLKSPSLRYLVDSTSSPTIPEPLLAKHAGSLVLLQTVGDFRIYAIRHSSD